jgi:hypothetical protein
LRLIVITCGRLLAAAGLILILMLPVAVSLRCGSCLLWLAWSWFELRRYHQGYAAYCRIRVGPGADVQLLNGEGEWVTATLLSGSVLMQRIGWLHLETADGISFAELIRGDCRESDDWRRLQVIWRHIGAAT